MDGPPVARLRVAVIGSGVAGLSAAWLLSRRHDVTVFEAAGQLGGHCNTVDVPMDGDLVPVDTGFIVFNPRTYRNFVALLDHLGVATKSSEMSFGVSLDGGRLEYSGGSLAGLVSQPRNILRPRFWSMLAGIIRFYRDAPRCLADLERGGQTLGAFLAARGYGAALRDDHLLPMAGAIWSASPNAMLDYPAAAFVRFFLNHDLLRLRDRPSWRTVSGGSRVYVQRLVQSMSVSVRLNDPVRCLERDRDGVTLIGTGGRRERYDRVVIATHADQALAMLANPSPAERDLLGAFGYTRNVAVLHTDAGLMPRRRLAWSSWNLLRDRQSDDSHVCVSYWMNRLHGLNVSQDVFVTLNPLRPPNSTDTLHTEIYAHPMFDKRALAAQKRLWSLQGRRHTWFCGAYFGAGFHEDGLQSGLAVAEALGGVRRPWSVAGESDRIHLSTAAAPILVPDAVS